MGEQRFFTYLNWIPTKQVQVWKTRGDVPHSITATSSLTQAILHDEHCVSTRSKATSPTIMFHSVASTYAIALIHFVTGTTDTEQTKKDKVTMYKAAESVGLPYQFVDLRNDVVHGGKLPLAQFRESAKLALEWLWNNYWSHVIGRDRTAEDEKETRDALLALERLTIELDSVAGSFARFVQNHAKAEAMNGANGLDQNISKHTNKVQDLCMNRRHLLTLFGDLLTSETGFQRSMQFVSIFSTWQECRN